MSEVNNAAVIGPFEVRLDDEAIERIRNYDKGLGSYGHDRAHAAPASFFVIDLYVLTAANSSTVPSAKIKAPFPLTIWAIDVACETCAATDGLIDVLVGGTSILDTPQTVKATLTTPVRVAPEDGSEEVAYNSTIHITQQATSAAAMVGGQAHLYCQRL